MPQQAANATSINLPLVVFSLTLISWILTSQIQMLVALIRRQPLWQKPRVARARWTGLSVVATLLSYVAIQKLVGDLVSDSRPGNPEPRMIMLTITISNLLFIVVGPSILRRTSRVATSDFNLLGANPGESFRTGVAAWPRLAPWIYLAFVLALQIWPASKHPVEQMLRSDRSSFTILLATISAVVMAPLGEELLFRAIILAWLTKRLTPEPRSIAIDSPESTTEPTGQNPEPASASQSPEPWREPLGFWTANITTSIIFAMLHSSVWPSPIPIFLLSLGLGYLYHLTGGMAAPLGLHTTFNGISTLFLNLSLLSGNPVIPEPKPTPPACMPPAIVRDR